MFNVIGFGLFSSFALLTASTSRVVIVNYSMPMWASLMAWLILGERLSIRAGHRVGVVRQRIERARLSGGDGASVVGLLLALCCALSWAAGTVYMKWARIPGDLLAITAWQIALGALVFGAGLLVFQGMPAPAAVSLKAVLAVVYNGLIGTGFAYILWFAIIERLPTATASLGSLSTPVVGIIQLDADARRTADDRGHDRLCADLCRRRVRADAAGAADSGAGAVSVLAKPRSPRPLHREGHPSLRERLLPSLSCNAQDADGSACST